MDKFTTLLRRQNIIYCADQLFFVKLEMFSYGEFFKAKHFLLQLNTLYRVDRSISVRVQVHEGKASERESERGNVYSQVR